MTIAVVVVTIPVWIGRTVSAVSAVPGIVAVVIGVPRGITVGIPWAVGIAGVVVTVVGVTITTGPQGRRGGEPDAGSDKPCAQPPAATVPAAAVPAATVAPATRVSRRS